MVNKFDIKQYSKDVADEMNYVKKWIAKRTARKMRNKLIKVYDVLIDQFYKYETKKYIRHGTQELGTCDGVNLYNSLQSKGGEPPTLQPSPHSIDGGIMIDAKDMNDEHYEVDKNVVLDFIINKGIRYPHRYADKWDDWEFVASYDDDECTAEGTIIEVLESIRDQLASKYADQAKEEAKKELKSKLKYIDIE